MDLVFGAERLDRLVAHADELLVAYRQDTGTRYLDHVPCTPPDRLVPEDLAVTILINSRVGSTAFTAVQDHGADIDLAALPERTLEAATEADRQQVAELIAEVARWPGFAASVASKVLHKKRPGLIPIIDNQAIFGAYMNPLWPERPSLTDSVYSVARIREALDWITYDLTRPENRGAWDALATIEPNRTRIDLFDMVWWIYFRRVEPVPVTAEAAVGISAAVSTGAAAVAAGGAEISSFVDNDDATSPGCEITPRATSSTRTGARMRAT